MTTRIRFWQLIIGIGLIAVDLMVKSMLDQYDLVVNKGVAFGILPQLPWNIVIGILILLVVYLWWQAEDSVEGFGYLLLWSGGSANLIDRFSSGGVRDFIYYPMIQLYGNLADIYLVGGMLLLLWVKYIKHRIATPK